MLHLLHSFNFLIWTLGDTLSIEAAPANASYCVQAVAGLLADAKQIVETARIECSNYRSQYGSNIPLKVSFLFLKDAIFVLDLGISPVVVITVPE